MIELLVVIAVISLLAALVVPGVNNAMRNAIATKCVNNLRQVATALDVYIQDHDNYYPSYPSSNGLYASQYGTVQKSTTSGELQYYISPQIGSKNIKGKYDPNFICPGTSKLESKYKDNVQYLLNHNARLDGNTAVDVWGNANPGGIKESKRRLSAPSNEWMMRDVDQTWKDINPGWGNYNDFAPFPGHYTKWNVLYFDFHVGDEAAGG